MKVCLMKTAERGFDQVQKGTNAGFTLLEILVTLVVLSSMLVGVAYLIGRSSEDTKASVTAAHMRVIGEAAIAYIKDNKATIEAVANPNNPYVIPVTDQAGNNGLTNKGYLDQSYNSINPYGHTVCVLVLKPAGSANLFAMVATTGGNQIDDEVQLAGLSSQIGVGGGAIYESSFGVVPPAEVQTTIQGAMGTWSMNLADATQAGSFFDDAPINNMNCDGSAGNTPTSLAWGHPFMALWLTELALGGGTAGDFLYRDAQADPGWNTMTTPILIDNDVDRENRTACGNDSLGNPIGLGAITAEQSNTNPDRNTRFVMSCVDVDGAGTLEWRYAGARYWGDSAPNYNALGNCSPLNDWQTRVTEDTYRAYTCDGGTNTWRALAVDQNGNLTVPGNLTVGGDATVTGDLTTAGNTTLGDAAGDEIKLTGKLFLESPVNVGGGCDVNTFARDAVSGQLLYCDPLTLLWSVRGGLDYDKFSFVTYQQITGPQGAVDYVVVNQPMTCPPGTAATLMYGGGFNIDQIGGTADEDIRIYYQLFVDGVPVDQLNIGSSANATSDVDDQGIPFSDIYVFSCPNGDGLVDISFAGVNRQNNKISYIRNPWAVLFYK